jgi:predicted  nucleic acid-binding Zn-ribbon protein
MDAEMTADINETIIKLSSNIATVLEKLNYTEKRQEEEHHNLEKIESKIDEKLGNLEEKIMAIKDDFERRYADVKKELGRYSVLAAVGTAVLIFALQQVISK